MRKILLGLCVCGTSFAFSSGGEKADNSSPFTHFEDRIDKIWFNSEKIDRVLSQVEKIMEKLRYLEKREKNREDWEGLPPLASPFD